MTAMLQALVVDDDKSSQRALAALVAELGFAPQTAGSLREARGRLLAEPPDVVLLDLGMPLMDGFEVASRMRADRLLEDTMLVALTGWGQPEHRRATAEAGFDRHLVKPVGLGDLRALLTLEL